MSIETPRATDIPSRIAGEIREQINRGVLSPGLQLRQMDLANQFSVSRVPVREALKLLAAEGLIGHDPNKGFHVAYLSSDEARQLYRIRYLLESELLSTVQWPNPQQLAHLETMVESLDEAIKDGDRSAWVTRHRQFHRYIFELSPNKVLVHEVLRLLTLTDRYRSLLVSPGFTADPRATQERHLVEALAARDRERLLSVFERARADIEKGMLAALEARGL
ncbi:MAG: GntR family transcriptional regulator [Pusillimonas sp.]